MAGRLGVIGFEREDVRALPVGELNDEELDTTEGSRAADAYHLNPVVDAFWERNEEGEVVSRVFGTYP